MSRRTFRAMVAGVEYDCPTTMTVLREAEQVSGASLIEAAAENRYGSILQGAIYAGLKSLGVANVADGKGGFVPLSYEAIGEGCNFAETNANYISFVAAMSPEATGDTAKNADAEEEPKRSRGGKSSDTRTDSSS